MVDDFKAKKKTNIINDDEQSLFVYHPTPMAMTMNSIAVLKKKYLQEFLMHLHATCSRIKGQDEFKCKKKKKDFSSMNFILSFKF